MINQNTEKNVVHIHRAEFVSRPSKTTWLRQKLQDNVLLLNAPRNGKGVEVGVSARQLQWITNASQSPVDKDTCPLSK